MTIGERIKAERARLKMDQVQFASALGVPQSYVSKWERDAQKPSEPNAIRLAKLTGHPVDAFWSKPQARAQRPSIDAVATDLDDADYQLLYDSAVRARESSSARTAAPTAGRAEKAKPRRARSNGSAPAA